MAIADYIADHSIAAGVRFLEAVEKTVYDLADYPHTGRVRFPPRARHPAIRSIAVCGFRNYLVFYRVTTDSVEVLRIMHGAQRLRRRDIDET